MEGLKKEHGVTQVRNPIGNHIPMSQSGHETDMRIHMGGGLRWKRRRPEGRGGGLAETDLGREWSREKKEKAASERSSRDSCDWHGWYFKIPVQESIKIIWPCEKTQLDPQHSKENDEVELKRERNNFRKRVMWKKLWKLKICFPRL